MSLGTRAKQGLSVYLERAAERGPLGRAALALKKGLGPRIRRSVNQLQDFANYPLIKARKDSQTFRVGEETFNYFTHRYNTTWRNERAVEMPLVQQFLEQLPTTASLLEVGNVLTHYLDRPHVTVDRYEVSPGVLNQDVLTYHPNERFDALVSISTLEHVGWDETPRDPQKVKLAFDHMRSLLTPKGRFFLTFPLGYNEPLDQLVRDQALPFERIHYLKRISDDNLWEEVGLREVERIPYGSPFPCANGLFVGIG